MLWNREDNVLLIFSIMSLPSSCIKRTKKQSRIGKTAAAAIGNGCCRVHIHWQISKPHRQWRCSRRVLDIVGGLEYKWRHQAELCKSVAVNMDHRVFLKRHNSFVSQQLKLKYPKISQKLATNSPNKISVKSTNWACNPGSSRELAKETLLRSTLTWKLLNPFLISVMPAGWTSTDLPLVASKPTPQNKLLIMWQWTKETPNKLFISQNFYKIYSEAEDWKTFDKHYGLSCSGPIPLLKALETRHPSQVTFIKLINHKE